MQFFIYFTHVFYESNWLIKIKILSIVEPFSGLFTQGMVCHETYKDEDGKWLISR